VTANHIPNETQKNAILAEICLREMYSLYNPLAKDFAIDLWV
jgi:hypothetical protein